MFINNVSNSAILTPKEDHFQIMIKPNFAVISPHTVNLFRMAVRSFTTNNQPDLLSVNVELHNFIMTDCLTDFHPSAWLWLHLSRSVSHAPYDSGEWKTTDSGVTGYWHWISYVEHDKRRSQRNRKWICSLLSPRPSSLSLIFASSSSPIESE